MAEEGSAKRRMLFGAGIRAAAIAAVPRGWLWARGIVRHYIAIPKLAAVRQDEFCVAFVMLRS